MATPSSSSSEQGGSSPLPTVQTRPYPKLLSERGAVLLLLGVFAVLGVHGLVMDTPTVDEFAHLPAGWYYLKTADFSLYPHNPPLLKALAALPLLALQPAIGPPPRRGSPAWQPWIFGTDFMERNRAIYDRIFLLGRLPILALGVLLGWIVWRWSRDLYGPRAGLISLAGYAFCPTLIAHAHLATIDAGAAAFMLLALWAFQRYVAEPSPRRLLRCGLALGLAELAKLSSLLLYPIFGLLALAALMRGDRFPLRPGARRPILGSLAALVVIFALSVGVLDLGYLFQGVGRPLASYSFHSHFLTRLASVLPGAFPVPLPVPFLEGFDMVQLDSELGEFPSYFLGRWSREGSVLYYPATLLFKTPLLLLAAWLAAPFARLRPRPRGELFVALPLLLLLAASSLLFHRIAYGIRYILPVLPLALIYMGRLAPYLETRSIRGLRIAALAALALYPLSALLATPNTLDYFNLLARGRGDRLLIDSNFDWGQGLKRVKAYMDREKLDHIGLAYFGHVDPAIYGIAWDFPRPDRPGLVAVSANFLHGYPYVTYAGGRMVPVRPEAFQWLEKYPEMEYLGGGVFLVQVKAN
ncbi:MAG TPA: glycosyltransferase family 39 protein [Thermoanaerobaculia bacterium]|nr:glycosyltransferase family 39 protein [Thermoanaerobaculia bacterium]